MIEFVVLAILILFIVWLIVPLLSSGLVFAINVPIIIICWWNAAKDLKKRKMLSFYLAGALVTTMMFIAKDTRYISFIFKFMENALVLEFTQAFLWIILFANIIKALYENYLYLSEKAKETVKGFKKK